MPRAATPAARPPTIPAALRAAAATRDDIVLWTLTAELSEFDSEVQNTSGDAEHPIILYDYQPSRAGTCAAAFLDGFFEVLHTDGYEAYHCKLPPGITVAGCWAHMRRKFMDTLKSLPKEIREKHPASKGLGYCNKLFALEESYAKNGFSFQKRYEERLLCSKNLYSQPKMPDGRGIFPPDEANFRRNTLCISRKLNEVMAGKDPAKR